MAMMLTEMVLAAETQVAVAYKPVEVARPQVPTVPVQATGDPVQFALAYEVAVQAPPATQVRGS